MPDEDKQVIEDEQVDGSKDEVQESTEDITDPDPNPLESYEKVEKPEEDEPAKEDEPKEPEATEKPTETFDPEILDLSAGLGVSEQQAKSFDSVRDLERHLYLKAQEGSKAPAAKEKTEEKSKQEPIQLANVADLDEEVVKSVNGALSLIEERYGSKVEQLEQVIQQVGGALQKNQAALFISRFDDAVDKLGKGYEAELGSGAMADLEPGSKEHSNRSKVIEEMDVLVAGYSLRGKPIPRDAVLFDRAVSGLFGEKNKEAARKELNDAMKARSKQTLQRPTSRSQKQTGTVRSRAIDAVAEKLASIPGLGTAEEESALAGMFDASNN